MALPDLSPSGPAGVPDSKLTDRLPGINPDGSVSASMTMTESIARAALDAGREGQT